jgi:hypothetical protein
MDSFQGTRAASYSDGELAARAQPRLGGARRDTSGGSDLEVEQMALCSESASVHFRRHDSEHAIPVQLVSNPCLYRCCQLDDQEVKDSNVAPCQAQKQGWTWIAGLGSATARQA